MSSTMGVILAAYFIFVLVIGVVNFFALYHIWRFHFSKSIQRVLIFTIFYVAIFLTIAFGPLFLLVEL